MNVLRKLNEVLRESLSSDPNLILLGEDIADPYGGAFKVTRGLSSRFPEQVISTPISEQCIAGMAAGYALSGAPVIVEVMFADFLFLCMDQIINHVSKFTEMYGRKLDMPIIFRTPTGGGRGYGPTHSQCVEKHFLAIPNVEVYFISVLTDIDALYSQTLKARKPAIIFEHKLLYGQEIVSPPDLASRGVIFNKELIDGTEIFSLSLVDPKSCSLTLVSYGFYTAHLIDMMIELAIEDEVFVNLIIVTDLKAGAGSMLLESANHTGHVVTVEESLEGFTWGEYLFSSASMRNNGKNFKWKCFDSKCKVIPASSVLEKSALLNLAHVKEYIKGAG